MDWGLRLCFLLALPSAVALGILAKPLTVALFQYGKFSAFDAAMTQRAGGLFRGADGPYRGESAGAGLLFPSGHQDPGQDCYYHPDYDPGNEPAFIGPLKHAGLSLSIGRRPA